MLSDFADGITGSPFSPRERQQNLVGAVAIHRGWFGGKDLRANYPQGTDPVVLGESANTITTYGYDPATGMQEPKVTLCQVRAA